MEEHHRRPVSPAPVDTVQADSVGDDVPLCRDMNLPQAQAGSLRDRKHVSGVLRRRDFRVWHWSLPPCNRLGQRAWQNGRQVGRHAFAMLVRHLHQHLDIVLR